MLVTWTPLELTQPRDSVVRAAWHVVLAPASYRGDALLAGATRPFDALPRRGEVAGAAAVSTLAGRTGSPVVLEECR